MNSKQFPMRRIRGLGLTISCCLLFACCAGSVALGYWTNRHANPVEPAANGDPGMAVSLSTGTGSTLAEGQWDVVCDPSKVMSPEACSRCHTQESRVWLNTPHAKNFEQLHRDPAAKQIASRMGIRSIKRSDLCSQCHYTRQQAGAKARVVAGVSCESCHGGGRDWIAVHNDFGGAGISREQESKAHELARIEKSISLGMRNPRNIYSIARSCLNCHTVPNEQLVNQGGHSAGSFDFELVAWSQGSIKHNFIRTGGQFNQPSELNRVRIMFVAGMMADIEFSLRAVGRATQRGRFGSEAAKRAARKAIRLKQLQDEIQDPNLQQALLAFAEADLATNNSAQLDVLANRIANAGYAFAASKDGSELTMVDRWLPAAGSYR